MVFDLDPGPPADDRSTARASALELRELLDELGLESVVKTSGGKGLHLGVPVHGRDRRRDQGVRARARADAREARPEARDHRRWRKRPAPRQGVRGLEPERPPQDDGRRVLAARPAPADGVDARLAGTRSPTRSTPGDPDSSTFEAADVLDARRRARRPLRAPTSTAASSTSRRGDGRPPGLVSRAVDLDGQGRDRHRREPRRRCGDRDRARAPPARGRVRGTRHGRARRSRSPARSTTPCAPIHDAGGEAIAVPTNLAVDDEVDGDGHDDRSTHSGVSTSS